MHYWVNHYLAPPDIPGGSRHAEFAALLRQRGVPIHLVGSDFRVTTGDYFRRRSAFDLAPHHDAVAGTPTAWLYAPPYEENDWRRIANMVGFGAETFRYLMGVPVTRDSVFIGSSPHLFAALAAERAAALRGVRFVFEVRDLWPDALIEMLGRSSPALDAMGLIADHLYRRAAALICLARGTIEKLKTRGVPAEKMVFVPNSVDPGIWRDPAPFDGPWPIPEGKAVALYAGAHGPANALDLLVEAARALQHQGEERLHIVLLGKGVEKERLVAQAEGLRHISFLDPVPKAAMPGVLQRASIGVLSLRDVPVFRYGISPNKLFEYMGAGLPVVSNVQGECAEIVDHAGCGRVVVPESGEAFAAGMIELLDHPERTTMGLSGRTYVETYHNRQTLVELLASVLR